MSRGALLTGTAGGIIGTITSVIGTIWSIVYIMLVSTLSKYISSILFLFFDLIFGRSTFVLLTDVILMLMYDPSGLLSLLFVTLLLLGVFLIVSCILTGVGFYGFYKAGGGAMGVVGLIFGIIGGIMGGVSIILGSLFVSPLLFGFVSEPNYILVWIGFIILAITFILLGSASIVVRETTTNPGASVAAGILSIIGGCFLFLYPLAIIGFPLMFVAFLLWAIVFFSSRDI